ncbi:MAG: rod shape-determining protein [Acidobacteria bacterium]|nr:rod shape-determining protein [Acidobacteriota bacterium]
MLGFELITADLAVDLGTVNTMVYRRGRGIAVSEPSLVAIDEVDDEVVAVGTEALEMKGREAEGVKVIRPVQHGVIAEMNLAKLMLQHFIRKARGIRGRLSRRVIIGVPSGATDVERNAVREAVHGSNVGRVYLVEEGLAAAHGAGINLTGPEANLVVDIGGGTTSATVVASSGVIFSRSERIGGLDIDEAIQQMVRQEHSLLIGDRTAERVKMELGAAMLLDPDRETKVTGRLVESLDTPHHRLASATITHRQVYGAIEPVMKKIVETIQQSMEELPPEAAGDVLNQGMTLTGGTALLARMQKRLEQEFKIPVRVAENPTQAVVLGMGRFFDDARLLRQIIRREDVSLWREYLTATSFE